MPNEPITNEPITNEPAGRPPRTLRQALTEYIAGMREVCGSTDMVDDGAGDLKAGWTDLEGAERADELEALLGAPDAEPTGMGLERAKEIVGKVCTAVVSGMGIPGMDTTDVEFLKTLSLAEMVEAKAVVNRWNDRPADESGRKTFQMVCDDRGTAALYAILHFKAERPGDCEPQMSIEHSGYLHHLCIIFTDKPASEDD